MMHVGVILIADRVARSSVVEAFRRAGWQPGADKNYVYVGRQHMGYGEVADSRYITRGTTQQVARLYDELARLRRAGHDGWDAYLEEGREY